VRLSGHLDVAARKWSSHLVKRVVKGESPLHSPLFDVGSDELEIRVFEVRSGVAAVEVERRGEVPGKGSRVG
jgi:hypothetical protein